MANTPEIINGKVVKRWFTRGKARIPVFEDGTIGLPDGSLRELKKEGFGRYEYHKAKKELELNDLKKQRTEALNKYMSSSEKGINKKVWHKSYEDARKMVMRKEKELELYKNGSEEYTEATKMIDYNAKTRVERYRNYNTTDPNKANANITAERKIVSDWENGAITTDIALKRFGGNKERATEIFESMGYHSPFKDYGKAVDIPGFDNYQYYPKTDEVKVKGYNEKLKEIRNRNTGMTKQEEITNRVKQNKIVDSFGNNVVYQNKDGNWINSRENYNNYVSGKSDKLGGELVLNEKEARQRLAEYDADEKYPYQGYVADMKSGNSEKAKKLTQENLDKMYKTIGYDDSKYNYGFNEDADIEFADRVINEVKTSKVDKISSKADMEIKKETQRIDKRPTISEVRKELRNMNSWSDEKQYGNIVVTKTGATGYHIRNVDDVSDPMTDYFAGVYGVKEKQVLKTLEEKGFITNNKDTKAKVERFKERKGTTRTNKTPTKRELAEKIVDNQIERGIVSKSSREMLIRNKMNMTKEELEKYFK